MPRKSPQPSPRRRWATPQVAAAYIDVNERTIRRMIAAGRLTGYRFGDRLLRVDLDELDRTMKPVPTVKAG
jgi:excisionase family DNA binding protein